MAFIMAHSKFADAAGRSHRWSLLPLTLSILLAGCVGGDAGESSTASSQNAAQGDTSVFDSSPVSNCNQHLSAGNAGVADQVLCRLGYVVGYDFHKKLASWAQYHLTAASVQASVTRVDNFREDPEVPISVRATLADYQSSGYDRGHLAPNATVDFSTTSMDESFLLSNIAPQNSTLNQNAWADLENYVRACTVTLGEMVVATGPYYNSSAPARIGNGVAVPDGFFTAMLYPRSPVKAVGFMVPNQAISNTMLPSYVTSIDAIETKTGLNLFPALKDSLETPVETQTTPLCPLPWSSASNGPGTNGGTGTTGGTGSTGGTTYGACGTKNFCSQMTSCAEARYFLNTCGVRTIDGDGDGMPCESICR